MRGYRFRPRPLQPSPPWTIAQLLQDERWDWVARWCKSDGYVRGTQRE